MKTYVIKSTLINQFVKKSSKSKGVTSLTTSSNWYNAKKYISEKRAQNACDSLNKHFVGQELFKVEELEIEIREL